MKNFKLIIALTFILIIFSGFSFGDSDDERRADRHRDSKEALELLYKEKPETREAIKSAYGYATFENYGMSMMISFEGGIGLAHNNVTGKDTYMNMGASGLGMGFGAKKFMAVFIFQNKKEFEDFISDGWEANYQADAAAQTGGNGDSINETDSFQKGVKLYKLTKNGLSMQLNIHGSKYWKCKDLN